MMVDADFTLMNRLLREVQAEMRSIRSEHKIVREGLFDLATMVSNRIAQFESHIDSRLDQTERSIEERLTRIETQLATISSRLGSLP